MASTSAAHWPDAVYVTREARNDPLAVLVLSRLGSVPVFEVDDPADPLSADRRSTSERLTLGKRTLLLRRHRGGWLEHCPGTKEHVCCNLWTVNPGEGCPYDCTYCFLQSYLHRNPTCKIFTNTADTLRSIESQAVQEPQRFFRICTGEAMDSLAWDELTDHSLELVPLFARIPNMTLELKTKSACIGNLLTMRHAHCGKTVVSWSVNALQVAASDEALAAPLDERIAAAARVAEAGYRVGLHFDPIVCFEGWRDGYRDAIRRIFSAVNPRNIAWISISTLRYQREMQKIMIERFPRSRLPFGEQFLAKDDKLRYAQPIRFRLLKFVWQELKSVSPTLPVYMCMESAAAWREVYGRPPSAGSELVEIFSRRGRMREAAGPQAG